MRGALAAPSQLAMLWTVQLARLAAVPPCHLGRLLPHRLPPSPTCRCECDKANGYVKQGKVCVLKPPAA